MIVIIIQRNKFQSKLRIHSLISLANKPRSSGKCGTLAWIADAVLGARLCLLSEIYYFSIINQYLLLDNIEDEAFNPTS